jgi:hypothetical protein
MTRILAITLLLSACANPPENESEASIDNRATALEKRTAAQVDRAIKAIEAEDQAEINTRAATE